MNANLTQLPIIHSVYIHYMYICISIRFADVYTVLLWTIMQWRLEIFFYICDYNHKFNIKFYELKKKQIVLFVHLVIINRSELFLFTIDNKPIYGHWPVNDTLFNTKMWRQNIRYGYNLYYNIILYYPLSEWTAIKSCTIAVVFSYIKNKCVHVYIKKII